MTTAGRRAALPPPPNPRRGRWGWISRPPAVTAAVVVGVAAGIEYPAFARAASPLGGMYLSFLSMCALPIIILSVAECMARALRASAPKRRIGYSALLFAGGGAMASLLGVALMLGVYGRPRPETRRLLGPLFLDADSLGWKATGPTAWELVASFVPDNLFSALSGGRFLACIFFSLVMGAAIGRMDGTKADRWIDALSQANELFMRIIRWGLRLLAPGLFFMIAGQFASLSLEALPTLGKLLGVFYLGCAVLCAAYTASLRRTSGRPLKGVVGGVGSGLGVAFAAASSALAMPLLFEGLEKTLGFRRAVTRFVLPFGVALNRQAFALLFSMVSVFALMLHDRPLTAADLASVCVWATVAGLPAVGAPAVIAPMIGYVLTPLDLPASAGVAILIALSPLVDPFASMTNLYASAGVAGMVDRLERRVPESDAAPSAATEPERGGAAWSAAAGKAAP